MSDSTNFDPLELIGRLVEQEVEFVVIGGMAATIRGAEIPTLDLDIVYRHARDNLERLAAALQTLDVRLRGAEDVPFRVDAIVLRNGDRFTFATPFGDFDCMATADGAPTYAELKNRASEETVGSYRVRVASLDDLIAMKQTTGRTKDIPKLAELIELRRLVEQEARGSSTPDDA